MTRNFPQRVIPTAPIGSLLKRITVAAPRRVLAETRGGGDPAYLALVRKLPWMIVVKTIAERSLAEFGN